MKGFQLITKDGTSIRFHYYLDAARVTSEAFHNMLPFTRMYYHARVSGEEFWIDDVPQLDIIQENASIYTLPGEVVFGPSRPARTRTANCFGIYYGEGKGLDAANIFARVTEDDLPKLKALGQSIWKNGAQELTVMPF
jgi:hypothetical protein